MAIKPLHIFGVLFFIVNFFSFGTGEEIHKRKTLSDLLTESFLKENGRAISSVFNPLGKSMDLIFYLKLKLHK